MIVNNRTYYPVERALLTTGMLAALMNSSWKEGQKLLEGQYMETPYLTFTYKTQKESVFDCGPKPPADPDFGICP
ncbi:hypothetical protein ACFL5B_01700 [Candidatus Latescibacterota bacterium]